MTVSLVLDFVVIGLLVATICYAFILNKRLATIYESRNELKTFLEGFSASLSKAEESVKSLKGAGDSAISSMEEKMTTATALRDDLTFIMGRGEDIAGRLEMVIRSARALNKTIEQAKQTSENENQNENEKAKEPKGSVESAKEKLSPTAQNQEPDLIRTLKEVR